LGKTPLRTKAESKNCENTKLVFSFQMIGFLFIKE
jgi:hypothetical protein